MAALVRAGFRPEAAATITRDVLAADAHGYATISLGLGLTLSWWRGPLVVQATWGPR
jgi:hypothetical protein